MSRLPLPSRWTLLAELVMVSISPVPKLEPGPVSYIHWESAPEPAGPLKSSLNTVDHPDGGAGTAAGAASAPRAADTAGPVRAAASVLAAGAAWAAGAATAAEAVGSAAAVNTATGAPTPSTSPQRRDHHRRMADLPAGGTCREMPVMTSLRTPLLGPGDNRKVSYL